MYRATIFSNYPQCDTHDDKMKDNQFFAQIGFIVKCSIKIFYILKKVYIAMSPLPLRR